MSGSWADEPHRWSLKPKSGWNLSLSVMSYVPRHQSYSCTHLTGHPNGPAPLKKVTLYGVSVFCDTVSAFQLRLCINDDEKCPHRAQCASKRHLWALVTSVTGTLLATWVMISFHYQQEWLLQSHCELGVVLSTEPLCWGMQSWVPGTLWSQFFQ